MTLDHVPDTKDTYLSC